jgi:hypothetical protein
MSKIIVLTGQRFDRLLVEGPQGSDKRGEALWRCLCDCGKVCAVVGFSLRNRRTKSCGCLQVDSGKTNGKANKKHGQTGKNITPEYRAWYGLKHRCFNEDAGQFKNYGRRGITVCERWSGPNGFENFFADVGPRPSKDHSIDRFPNNDGDYEPGNVRWATWDEQGINKRTNVNLTAFGETMPLSQWARKKGLHASMISKRLKAGWLIEDALMFPSDRGRVYKS